MSPHWSYVARVRSASCFGLDDSASYAPRRKNSRVAGIASTCASAALSFSTTGAGMRAGPWKPGEGYGMSPAKFAEFFRAQYDAFGATVREHNVKFE